MAHYLKEESLPQIDNESDEDYRPGSSNTPRSAWGRSWKPKPPQKKKSRPELKIINKPKKRRKKKVIDPTYRPSSLSEDDQKEDELEIARKTIKKQSNSAKKARRKRSPASSRKPKIKAKRRKVEYENSGKIGLS
mmetsp:Transcript_14739/g.22354  ORF Transcript_14739/g.22354 Transcript_14739/m.22354 type:complete len:135 (+) Transcript_14739:657-1061(+)